MPDPDIPPLIIGEEVVQHLSETLPKLPDQLLVTLTHPEEYGLSTTDAKILLSIDNGERLEYFEDVVENLGLRQTEKSYMAQEKSANRSLRKPHGKLVGNWVLHELGSLLTTTEVAWAENRVQPEVLTDILDHLLRNKITGSTAKQVLKMVFEGDKRSVGQIIREDGLTFHALSEDEYAALAKEVMANHQDVVQQIRGKGRTSKLMFLVGQMMRKGEEGRIEAKKAEEILRHLVVEKHV